MDPYPYTVYTVDNPIDEIGGKLEFLARIPAGGKGRSHEGTPLTLL